MITRSVFHLDCYSIIPGCQFQCAKCIQEIRSTLGEVDGVEKFYTRDKAENMKFIVDHDPSKVTVEHLVETFEHLPSFYKGFFVPKLLET